MVRVHRLDAGLRNPQAKDKPAATQATKYPGDALTAASRQAADELRKKLGKDFHIVVEPPFVIAGDFPPDKRRTRRSFGALRQLPSKRYQAS